MRIAFFLMAAGLLAAQTVSVSVEQGYVSRHRTPGAVAHVWAQQNTATRVFRGWAGDVQHLADPAAPYTTFVVPASDVRLQALYATVPAWTPATATLGEVPVNYFVPTNPVGLVFLFHGTGGTGANQFSASEFASFTRYLVAAGFGVAAFDSLNRQTEQWNTTTTGASNPDVVRVNAVVTAMRAQGLISLQLPLLAFGHSNGGQFAHFSSQVLPWAAVSISCVQGSPAASTNYRGPVAWWMGKNDDHPQVGAAGVATSLTRYESHVNRGMHGRHMISGPMPLYPERISRSSVLTMTDATEVYNIFKSNNWLDANDFLTRNPNDTAFTWRAAMPSRLTAGQLLGVQGQLEGTYSGHEFVNFTPHITIDLYLRAIGRRGPLRPVSGASFAGDALAPESIATIFAGGMASGLEIGANGPQANLRGVRGVLRSAAGTETVVPWFFVSPGQGSFLVPAGTATGSTTLKIESGDRRWGFPATIAATSPGVFTANGSGQGVPAAVLLRVAPDNTRSTEFPFVAGAAGFVAAPIRFGDDRLFLDLYATGVRGSTSVQVLLGSETLTPLYAGAQPQFIGLDQVTFELPRALAGAGKVEVTVVAGGVRGNTVELNFGN
ncbi:MAG: hypothetical protein ACK6DZ_20570 [Acidobacteriota bacterium]